MNTFLAIAFLFQIGYAPMGIAGQYDVPESDGKCLYSDLGIEFKILDLFFIKGATKTYFIFDEFHGFPFFAYYSFGAGIRFNGIEIGYNHKCLHPVISNQNNIGNTNSYDEIYFKIQTNDIKIF